jgi:phosphonate transport system ATP-binding protein
MQPCSQARFHIDALTVEYPGVTALHDVSLDVEPGEAVAFVGPSGAGKTTLLRVLNGTLRPTSGVAQVGDKVLTTLSNRELRQVRACIGFVHQSLDLAPNLRVVQNVVSGRLGRMSLLHSIRSMLFPARDELRRAHAILERVGIPEKLYERTDRLSGGQQQRVAIARALFQEPTALLADEPVSSVDPARARDSVALLTEISREEALTLCVSIHNLDLARDFFPRLVGLREGRVQFDKPTAEVSREEFAELYRLEQGNGAVGD